MNEQTYTIKQIKGWILGHVLVRGDGTPVLKGTFAYEHNRRMKLLAKELVDCQDGLAACVRREEEYKSKQMCEGCGFTRRDCECRTFKKPGDTMAGREHRKESKEDR